MQRARLDARWDEVRERTAIIVTAPQGFGKTTLLAQWRRSWLEQGAVVAWASLDAQDDRARFVDLIFFALRAASGRESFSAAALQGQLQANRDLDTLTALLAEIAVLATPTVIVLDDAHRMPQATLREVLAYLCNNAPPNLQFLIGSRRPLELDLSDLVMGGRLGTVNIDDLRLDLGESLELLRVRFGNRIGLDDAVRLHDLMEGWPLGMQLAVSTIERAPDLHVMVGELSARRGDLERFFFESVLSRLSADEASFLIRISILETVRADVCEAVTGCAAAAAYLEKLADESPVVTEGEGRDWLRLHAMARDYLRGQFERLPDAERRACYQRAAAWYADHGQLQEAARHALAAGDETLALAHAEQCLLDIGREGRLAEAHEWIRRLPASAMSRDVRLQLTVAWVTALGDGAASVPGLIEEISQHPQFDAQCRFEAALVTATAGIFCDKPGLVADALEPWGSSPAGATPLHIISLSNGRAVLALHSGDNDLVRRHLLSSASTVGREATMRLPLAFADLLLGLSHVMDGNAIKAISVLRPQLEMSEHEMGRRNAVAAMLAGPLAAAYMLRGEHEQALATLADRLDVIEGIGMPDATMLAYRALAGIALRRGEEARALEILAALYEFGVARQQPRVLFVSLAEQIRVHSLRGRVETAAELLMQLDALRSIFDEPAHRPFRWLFERTYVVANAYAQLARFNLEGAERALNAWLAAQTGAARGPVPLVARALLALVAHQRGRPEARDMLAEVLSLAELGGMRSYVEEAHPRFSEILAPGTALPSAGASLRADAAPRTAHPVRATTAPAQSGLLTPKEARILSMLATGKANKEIARAMDVGEQTVKWHLKNVFFKLNAASRKHAVDRARLLGVLDV